MYVAQFLYQHKFNNRFRWNEMNKFDQYLLWNRYNYFDFDQILFNITFRIGLKQATNIIIISYDLESPSFLIQR